MKYDFNSIQFKTLLKEKRTTILQNTSDGIKETDRFKQLYTLLISARQRYKSNDFKNILINEADIINLVDDIDVKINMLFQDDAFVVNKHIVVDNELTIVTVNNEVICQSNNEARRYLTDLSKKGMVVFSVAPNSVVNYFVDGKEYGEGIFYKIEEYQKYDEKKSIEDLAEVLDEYRNHLTHRDTYEKFFIQKSFLRSLRVDMKSPLTEKQFVANYKHVLNNDPEDIFREDLRLFLLNKMKVFANKEYSLESLKRLDIVMYSENGDLYFIEVKWVGQSIHKLGKQLGIEYDERRIVPAAVFQTVGYIDELLSQGDKLKFGYLAVFDARKDDMQDTGTNISENILPEVKRKNYYRFKKIPDFRVKNRTPR